MKDYKTVSGEATSEFVEKKSRFISYICPVSTESEATDFISRVGAMHREASHVVYAYVLLDGQIRRYSDAGEPSGTAGMPTLEVLLKNEIFNSVIATVRYFGGTLLGTGGLTRAYSKAASDALLCAQTVVRTYGRKITLEFDYGFYGKISTFLFAQRVVIASTEFNENVTLSLFAPEGMADEICEKLVDLTAAKIKIEKNEYLYFDI